MSSGDRDSRVWDGSYHSQYSPRYARGEGGGWKDAYHNHSPSGHGTYDSNSSYPPNYHAHSDPRMAVYSEERKSELESRGSGNHRIVYHEKSGAVEASELQG